VDSIDVICKSPNSSEGGEDSPLERRKMLFEAAIAARLQHQRCVFQPLFVRQLTETKALITHL